MAILVGAGGIENWAAVTWVSGSVYDGQGLSFDEKISPTQPCTIQNFTVSTSTNNRGIEPARDLSGLRIKDFIIVGPTEIGIFPFTVGTSEIVDLDLRIENGSISDIGGGVGNRFGIRGAGRNVTISDVVIDGVDGDGILWTGSQVRMYGMYVNDVGQTADGDCIQVIGATADQIVVSRCFLQNLNGTKQNVLCKTDEAPGFATVSDNIVIRTDGETTGGACIRNEGGGQILRNMIRGGKWGVQNIHETGSGNYVVANVMFLQGEHGIIPGGASAQSDIAQNVIADSAGDGLHVDVNSADVRLYNNIIFSAGADGINRQANNVEQSNCIHGSTSSAVSIAGSPSAVGEGSITQDPSFRNPGDDDYRLNGDSPCIGAGTRWWTGEPPQGQDGRRFCSPPSMGAYEYYGGGRAGAIPARVKPAGVDIAKARKAA